MSATLKPGAAVGQRTYAGHEFDADTGLSYQGARYYDPEIGRFTSQDPAFLAIGDPTKLSQATKIGVEEYLSNPQHINSYSYAFNNPLVYIDEEGKFAIRTFGVGLLQGTKSLLGVASTATLASGSGGALALGNPQISGMLAIGAVGSYDSALSDASNAMTNLIGSFKDRSPAQASTQGPYRNIAQQISGDTKLFDSFATGGEVLGFTGLNAPKDIGKLKGAYHILQNAQSAGVGRASMEFMTKVAGRLVYDVADIATKLITGQGILDHVERQSIDHKRDTQ
jgi:RHS repeat-associated protein